MPSISFDKDALTKVAATIYQIVDGPELIEQLRTLKKRIDWNPFDEDGDEFAGPWAEIRQNFKIVGEVAMQIVHCAERLVVEGRELSAPQKHAACVQALDDILRLPWYLEPLDGPAFDLVVSTAVAAMNSIGWVSGSSDGFVDAKITKIEIGEKITNIEPAKVLAARAEMAGAFREVG
jgi:hypothetical protein